MTEETIKVLEELRGIVNSFVIRGSGVAGNLRNGYTVNPGSGQISSGSGGGGVTPANSGACCPVSGDCFIATQNICETGDGTYQGDDTTCDPDPCPASCSDCVGFQISDGLNCWTSIDCDGNLSGLIDCSFYFAASHGGVCCDTGTGGLCEGHYDLDTCELIITSGDCDCLAGFTLSDPYTFPCP